MPQRTADYKINKTTFRVCYGSITELVADALVSSDDNYLTMGGGISLSLLLAGGETIQREARKQVPLKPGDVAVTSAGHLKAKFIFHAVTIDYDNIIYPNEEIVCSATERCLQLADALNVRLIGFPALGTGVGNFPFQLAADCMTRTVADYLMKDTRLELVTLTLFAREHVRETDLNVFYERAVALASVSAQSKKLHAVMADLQRLVTAMNRPDLVKRVIELQEELGQAQDILAERPQTLEHTDSIQRRSNIDQISQQVISVSTQTQEAIVWNDRQLEAEVQRTKIQGLLARLNIQQSQLNKLEIERAKYGGIGVPVRLETAIEELNAEMSEMDKQIKETRQYITRLNAK